MIYFLYGEDSYRSREKLKEIIESYKKVHKSGLSLNFFDFDEKGREVDFSEINSEYKQASMFKEKKLLVLSSPFKSADFKKRFLNESKKLLESSDLLVFYEDNDIDSKDALFKFLLKNAKCQKFEFLTGAKLKNWATKEFEKYEVKTEPFAIEKLVMRTGSDLWRMSNEIKKLACFRKGGCISLKDIDIFIKPKIESDIFKTIDAIALKNKKEALSLIHKHIENGDAPIYLLSMINYQFRNVLSIKDLMEKKYPFNLIASKSGLHPYVVKKSYFQAQSFSSDGLKKIYQKIFQADLDSKTGRIGAEEAIDMFIAEI
ncbi:MAG: DNA polymerase III subunit delta [Candidatus Nealsonbacteria bacterium]|nr:DNA polymerase III subunit delta [Candidatus Nealsonbacteria bacterium]